MLPESGAMEGMLLIGLMRSRRVWPLTLAQSCGALNDNLVKNAMIVLAIFKLGIGGAGLSALAGALFIAPYILLSASAGTLADRFAKPRLIVIYKLAEIALMIAAAAAFLSASVPALLAVLVGLGIQAALFGPVKYGVLPEYLAETELLAGNGIIEATTFLSIVCGTVAGGGLILLDTGPAIVGAIGVTLSLFGVAGAACMPPSRPADPGLHLIPNILADTWHVVGAARSVRPIWLSVLGLSWFWTMGATLLTEFPVVARDTMQAEGSVLTVLLAVFAIGVGIGSIGTTGLLHGEASARFAPLTALGISLFCWDFSTAASAANGVATARAMIGTQAGWRMLADLTLLAACGGVFSVPLYAIIQEASVPEQRSRMISANNIMNALFMVAGSGATAALAAAGLDAPAVLRVAAGANLLVAMWIFLVLRREPVSR
jgi:acyl-[acyl-carrier-protein]-phospholipid O-acyltransferase/long-chain-fatty-acid--[acyl-carrier-protein] ligase